MHDSHISFDYPFDSKYATVYGSKLHYIEEGERDVILCCMACLHGHI